MNSDILREKLYDNAVQWIADNDEPCETDVDAVADQISVLLVADVFINSPSGVALDVLAARSAP